MIKGLRLHSYAINIFTVYVHAVTNVQIRSSLFKEAFIILIERCNYYVTSSNEVTGDRDKTAGKRRGNKLQIAEVPPQCSAVPRLCGKMLYETRYRNGNASPGAVFWIAVTGSSENGSNPWKEFHSGIMAIVGMVQEWCFKPRIVYTHAKSLLCMWVCIEMKTVCSN